MCSYETCQDPSHNHLTPEQRRELIDMTAPFPQCEWVDDVLVIAEGPSKGERIAPAPWPRPDTVTVQLSTKDAERIFGAPAELRAQLTIINYIGRLADNAKLHAEANKDDPEHAAYYKSRASDLDMLAHDIAMGRAKLPLEPPR